MLSINDVGLITGGFHIWKVNLQVSYSGIEERRKGKIPISFTIQIFVHDTIQWLSKNENNSKAKKREQKIEYKL